MQDYQDKIKGLKIEEIKEILAKRGYIGKLPVYKKDILALFEELFVEKEMNKADVDYNLLTLVEITAELKKKNITKNLPRTKQELLAMLTAPRCDPVDNVWCDDDKVCDILNGICVDKDSQAKGKIVQATIKNHMVSGTKAHIKALLEKIDTSQHSGSAAVSGMPKFSPVLTSNVMTKTELVAYLKALKDATTTVSKDKFNNYISSLM